MLEAIGGTIRQRRKDLGLTQEDLAAISGMSDRTLREIEQGSSSPSIGALAAACNSLGLTLTAHTPEPPIANASDPMP